MERGINSTEPGCEGASGTSGWKTKLGVSTQVWVCFCFPERCPSSWMGTRVGTLCPAPQPWTLTHFCSAQPAGSSPPGCFQAGDWKPGIRGQNRSPGVVATISCCPHPGRAASSEPPPCCDRLMGHSDVGRSWHSVGTHSSAAPSEVAAQAYQAPWENPTFAASPS